MTACEAGRLPMIDLLVSKAPKQLDLLSYRCQSGSPLHAAITGERASEAVQKVIDLIESAAVEEGDPDLADKIINQKDMSGVHPLFLAVYCGNVEVTKYLLANGADAAKASDTTNATLLHICAERGHSEICSVVC